MTSYVYFLRPVGKCGPVKIGVSRAPQQRLERYSAWSPYRLEIAATIKGGRELEQRFHSQFSFLHSHGEWFAPDERLTRLIEDIGAGHFDPSQLPEPKRLPRPKGCKANAPMPNAQEVAERGQRLKRAALKAGYSRAKDFIDAHAKDGVKSSYYQHSKGNAAFSFKYAELYGRLLGVSPEWLYSGTVSSRSAA